MTENVIATEYYRLAAETIWAGEILATGDFIAGYSLLVNGCNRALQLCQAGVPGAEILFAAWNCALYTRTGCRSFEWTGEDEISYYPSAIPTW